MQVVNILRFYWVFIIFKYEKHVIVIAPVYDTNIKLNFKSNYNMIFYVHFYGILYIIYVRKKNRFQLLISKLNPLNI